MRVTFDDAYREIASGSSKAGSWVGWWRSSFAAIVEQVQSFVHEQLFNISSDEVAAVLARSEHALGDVEKERQIRVVEDTRMPPTAMQDMFHRFVEQNSAVPTWDDFREFLLAPAQKALLITPWWQTLRPLLREYDRDRVRDALRWRIARMYYSNMREVDFLARMRERHDIWLKYHIFADVRLRTDFWIGNHNVSVFLSNSTYRGRGKTRKEKAEELLGDRRPAFQFHEVEFPNLYERGTLYRVSNERIDELAALLRT